MHALHLHIAASARHLLYGDTVCLRHRARAWRATALHYLGVGHATCLGRACDGYILTILEIDLKN